MQEKFFARPLVYPKQFDKMDLETARALTAAEAAAAEAEEPQEAKCCPCPCPCCARGDTDEQEEKDCTCTCECCVSSRSAQAQASSATGPDAQEAGKDHDHESEHESEDGSEGDSQPWELALAPAAHQEHTSAMPSFASFHGGSPMEFDLACAEDPQLAAAMHYKIGERVHAPFDMWGLHDVSAAGWSARRNSPVSYIATRFMMYQTWAMGLAHDHECKESCVAPPTSRRGSKIMLVTPPISRPATPGPGTSNASNDDELSK